MVNRFWIRERRKASCDYCPSGLNLSGYSDRCTGFTVPDCNSTSTHPLAPDGGVSRRFSSLKSFSFIQLSLATIDLFCELWVV